jgi:cystathionine beta-lyase
LDDRFDAVSVAALRDRRSEKWLVPDGTLSASIAEMDFEIAEPIRRAIAHSVSASQLGYAERTERISVRDAFAARLKDRYAWTIDQARIELYTDVMQGVCVAIWALVPEGESVLVLTPTYPRFLEAVEKSRRRLVTCELARDATTGAHLLDEEAVRRAIDPSIRAILFCNPQNPTGRVFTRAELEALANIAAEHDLILIADEIHSDLMFAGGTHIPIATLSDEIAARTITLTSATKAFNIPGLRCAFGVVGSAKLQASLRKMPAHLLGGPDPLGVRAALAAFRDGADWLRDLMIYLDVNRALVEGFAKRCLPESRFTPPEATYLAWIDAGALRCPGTPWDYFAEHARVILGNGPNYGPKGQGFVRLNFATSRALLIEILGRLEQSIRDATRGA